MEKIEIKCLQTTRARAIQNWSDSGRENILIIHEGKKVCLEVKKRPLIVNSHGEEEPQSDRKRRVKFARVENVFLNDQIPVYREVS